MDDYIDDERTENLLEKKNPQNRLSSSHSQFSSLNLIFLSLSLYLFVVEINSFNCLKFDHQIESMIMING